MNYQQHDSEEGNLIEKKVVNKVSFEISGINYPRITEKSLDIVVNKEGTI